MQVQKPRMIGYARVSTSGQTLSAQIEQLKAAGCTTIFQEMASGARTDRPQLKKAIAALPSNWTTSAFNSVGESASRSPGEAILPGNQRHVRRGSENRIAATRFATVTGQRSSPMPTQCHPDALLFA